MFDLQSERLIWWHVDCEEISARAEKMADNDGGIYDVCCTALYDHEMPCLRRGGTDP